MGLDTERNHLGPTTKKGIDRLFDRVEQAFNNVTHENNNASVPLITVSRYHWNADDIIFDWTGQDGIDRNVQAELESGVITNQLCFRVHAWRDQLNPDQSGVRYWQVAITDHLSPPFRRKAIEQILSRSYQTVSKWNNAALTQVHALLSQ